MGFTGDAFDDPTYSITKPNDGYLFVSAANSTVGGNLVLSTDYTGSYNDIVIGIGSFLEESEVARFHGNTSNNGYLNLQYTTAASSTTTGAMRVAGGMGIGGSLYAGSIQNTPIGSATASTGAFTTVTTSSTLISSGNIVAASGTDSTNTTTGALVVKGGLGVSGNIYSGDNSTFYAGYTTINNQGIFQEQGVGPRTIQVNMANGYGIGIKAASSSDTQYLFSANGIQFLTGATVNSKSSPSDGTVGVYIAQNGNLVAQSGTASTSTSTDTNPCPINILHPNEETAFQEQPSAANEITQNSLEQDSVTDEPSDVPAKKKMKAHPQDQR
jgi:hypothetical protein